MGESDRDEDIPGGGDDDSPEIDDDNVLSSESEPVETELVRVIDFTGKPPFKRKLKEVPIVDAASLEIEDAEASESKSPLRRKAGFKRHR